MTQLKLIALLTLGALAMPPGLAEARTHHHHHYRHHHHHHHVYVRNFGLPYEISFRHNYGPGLRPGSFAYYDGPSNNYCYQSAASYVGQDHRKYPCF
jgi:hypothetical protein